jgi:hypothetical protein
MSAAKHAKTMLASAGSYIDNNNRYVENQGPRGDITCKQQPMRSLSLATAQESYSSNFHYIYGSEEQGQLSLNSSRKSATTGVTISNGKNEGENYNNTGNSNKSAIAAKE